MSGKEAGEYQIVADYGLGLRVRVWSSGGLPRGCYRDHSSILD